MQYRVLGRSVEVTERGRQVALSPQVATVLAILLLAAVQPSGRKDVSRERLTEALWGPADTEDRTTALANVVSRLRKAIGRSRVVTTDVGWRLEHDESFDYIDLLVFRREVEVADEMVNGDPECAVILYDHALGLWSDASLSGLGESPALEPVVEALRGERLSALETWCETMLALGRNSELVRRMPLVLAADPLNEHLRGLYMLALARSGRRARAVAEYDAAERVLRADIGAEPGRALRRLRQQILQDDPVIAWDPPPVRAGDQEVLARGANPAAYSFARLLDYAEGGVWNLPIDRAVANIVMALAPAMRYVHAQSVDFCRRAVRVVVKEGIDQLIEIATGLVVGNPMHRVARTVAPGVRVVYSAWEHSAPLDDGDLTDSVTGVVHADIREPRRLLEAPETRRLIDFTRPVAVLIRHVINFLGPDDDPYEMLEELVSGLPPGSYLILQVATHHDLTDVVEQQIAEQRRFQSHEAPLTLWSRAEVARMFCGLPLVEPGLVECKDWRPDRADRKPTPMRTIGGVARKG